MNQKAIQITITMFEHLPEMTKFLKRVYNNQRSHSKEKKEEYPNYNFEQFEKWSYCQTEFFQLFLNYKNTGETSDLPSVDRVDSLKGYSFDNNEWVTWSENHRRQSEDRRNGTGSTGRTCRAVLRQKDVKVGGGVLVQSLRFHSVAEAARVSPVKVQHYLKTGRTDKNGFRWVYEKENTKPLAKTKHEAETGIRYE